MLVAGGVLLAWAASAGRGRPRGSGSERRCARVCAVVRGWSCGRVCLRVASCVRAGSWVCVRGPVDRGDGGVAGPLGGWSHPRECALGPPLLSPGDVRPPARPGMSTFVLSGWSLYLRTAQSSSPRTVPTQARGGPSGQAPRFLPPKPRPLSSSPREPEQGFGEMPFLDPLVHLPTGGVTAPTQDSSH